jgi:hypothetical protein
VLPITIIVIIVIIIALGFEIRRGWMLFIYLLTRTIEDFEASLYLTGSGTLHAVLRKDRSAEVKQPIVRSNSTRLTDAARSSPVIVRDEEEESPTPDIHEIPEAPVEGEEEPLFLPGPDNEDSSDDEYVPLPTSPTPKTRALEKEAVIEDKKKLKFRTEYEGFTIYDKVLCLVITRKEKKKDKAATREKAGLIEGWIVMSQAVRDGDAGGDEDKED